MSSNVVAVVEKSWESLAANWWMLGSDGVKWLPNGEKFMMTRCLGKN